jgi:hypothetical protein
MTAGLLAGVAAILLVSVLIVPLTGRAAERYRAPDPVNLIEGLTADADLIIRGQIRAQTTRWDEPRTSIVTDNVIEQRYVIAGSTIVAPMDQIVVRTLGGVLLSEGIGLGVSHEAHFEMGQEVLLFLQAVDQGPYYRVVGGEAGALTVGNGEIRGVAWPAAMPVADAVDAIARAAVRQTLPLHLPETWSAAEELAGAPGGTTHDDTEDFVDLGISWPGDAPTVPYVVNVNSSQMDQGDGSAADFLAAILAAAATWNEVGGADFTFDYRGPTGVTSVDGANGINEIIFRAAGQTGVLGQTRYWYDPATSTVVEADVWFNDSYDWDTTGAPAGSEIDLESVALHEFGHWFVLGHDDEPPAIMYYAISAGVTKRTLYSTDIAGISSIYPCENPPCSSQSEPPEPPTPTFTPTELPTEMPTEPPLPTATATLTPTVAPTATLTPTIAPPNDPPPPPNDPEPTPTFTPTGPPPPADPTPTPAATAVPDGTPETVEVAPGEETVVQFGAQDGAADLVLLLPGDALSQTTTLAYAALDEPAASYDGRGVYAGAHFVLSAAQGGTAVDDLTFLSPVRFEVAYPEPDNGLDEAALSLYHLDGVSGQWQTAACGDETVDEGANIVVADVCQVGRFALFQTLPDDMRDALYLPLIRR